MKSIFFTAIAASLFLISCGSGNTGKPGLAEGKPEPGTGVSNNPDYIKGKELVAKSDCFSCHKTDVKLIGPGYVDVANKYTSTPENITRLANTIVKGVTPDKAVWGKLPMTAHPQIPQADAEQMVKYILLLKK